MSCNQCGMNVGHCTWCSWHPPIARHIRHSKNWEAFTLYVSGGKLVRLTVRNDKTGRWADVGKDSEEWTEWDTYIQRNITKELELQ